MGKQPAGRTTVGKAAAGASSASTSAKQAKTAAAAISAVMPHEEIATSKELQAKAEDGGLVRSDRMPHYEYPLLHASKELRQMGAARSIDIVKKAKGAANKPRYLIALPAQLAPMDGGTIGSIERLDTPNPEIYLEWPGQGRLRLRGTLLYPKAKLITLQPRAGQLYCEEAFDNVLVFSEAGWLPPLTRSEGGGGNSAEGGDAPARSLAAGDASLVPIPAAVQQRIHKKWSFSAGAAAEYEGARARPTKSYVDQDSDVDDVDEDVVDVEEFYGERARVKPKPAAKSSGGGGGKAATGGGGKGKATKVEAPAAPKPSAPKRPTAKKATETIVVSDDSDDDFDVHEDDKPKAKKKAPPKKAAAKPAAAPKPQPPKPQPPAKKRKRASSSDEDSVEEFDDVGGGSQGGSQLVANRSRRASASTAKKYVEESDEDDSDS
ncbi:DNA-binding protein rhl1 [Chrysochromulina tobinii]|uniref:DNA-binding protein rhl1 n=1 Tax=Chrysochromulina tobinii TaxID=1460289 RepID=A0A0M0JTC2_9EUKA|nr:DNA-binding protein rhl1 [Chrysochromulina tobinii]|eukprot:KOO29418.1 DNA-binding protein rhl1 [Chrysochromulina sp. CCMP291]